MPQLFAMAVTNYAMLLIQNADNFFKQTALKFIGHKNSTYRMRKALKFKVLVIRKYTYTY